MCLRLESHYAKKDFWNRAVFFVSTAGQLNKAHVQYLEHRLIDLAKDAKRMALDNVQSPSQPTLSEADRTDMEVFVDHILGILPVLGIQAFEKPQKPRRSDSTKLFISANSKGITGSGAESTQGFTVHKGSAVAANEVPSIPVSISELRAKLRASGVIIETGDGFEFAQDYDFSSPSKAACVVLRQSANG